MAIDLLKSLNDQQREAVISTEGPVLCMAGAGTGKTRVLTYRIAYLVSELGVTLDSILALTFTNKAANEMKERVSKLVDARTSEMWISTFHSFCSRMLRSIISHNPNYQKNFVIIDEDDSLSYIKECFKELNIDTKKTNPRVIADEISKIKNDEYIKSMNDNFNKMVMNVSNLYNKKLMANNLLDFDDLIKLTIEILEENDDLRKFYSHKFNYILIDEFQDTNKMQYRLIKILGLESRNVFIVGDQDQSIYSFRGARVENIDYFIKDFKKPKIVLLEENYRSTKNILDVANNVIKYNESRIKKNLFTDKKSNDKIYYYIAESNYDEVMFVAEKIRTLVNQKDYKYSDFAIMYRINSLSRGFEDAFIKYQIPYVIYGGFSFFQRREIKDIISYIRLIINEDDNHSFRRVINVPARHFGDKSLDKLMELAAMEGTSLFKAIDNSNQIFGKTVYVMLEKFRELIYELRHDFEKNDLEDLVDNVFIKTGYKQLCLDEGDDGLDRIDNIMELKSVIKDAKDFYAGTKEEVLEQFLADMALRTDMDRKETLSDNVKIMSFHQAKGLEFRCVFMTAMEESIFPNISVYKVTDIEEERRICYVGVTRAMETLYLTRAISRRLYGENKFNPESRFIREMGQKNLYFMNKRTTIHNESEEKPFYYEPNSKENSLYQTGDIVEHKMFGLGTVVSVSGDIMVVAFKAPYGIKNILKNHPSIRKINVA